MKRKMYVGLLVIVTALILLMAGCGCQHQWLAATCSAPKTCQLCGETEGETLPHTWQEATCSAAKTCTVCAATEGDALPHTWQEATCTVAKTCSVCQTTGGDPLGHTWQDATCTTVKTCTVCQVTEGEPLGHTYSTRNVLTKASCTKDGTVERICADCGHTAKETIAAAGHSWSGATCTTAGVCTVCGAKGSKAKHTYVTSEDQKPSETFAGYRVKKCSACGKENAEYYTKSHTYDLDSIASKIASHAKSKGFKPVIKKLDEYSGKVAYGVWELERAGGPDKLIKDAKKWITNTYNEMTEDGASLGDRELYIYVYYVQSGSFGGGFFGVYMKPSF